MIVIMSAIFASNDQAVAGENPPKPESARCIGFELYVAKGLAPDTAARKEIERIASRHQAWQLRVFEVEDNNLGAQRLAKICGHFKVASRTPAVYGCGQLILTTGNADQWSQELERITTLTAYVREGCQRCAKAKEFLPQLLARYPGFSLRTRDLVTDLQAAQDLQELTRRYQLAATSVPVFHACNQMVVGFDNAATTGPRLESMLHRWTVECPAPVHGQKSISMNVSSSLVERRKKPLHSSGRQAILAQQTEPYIDDLLPLPDQPGPPPPPENSSLDGDVPDDTVDLPVFGRVQVRKLGLPLFTLAVGLVDGFNPCAMWVLLFLLSVLVNLHDRRKILAVAGTFVVISGAAYFAFMAAWLNVFQWIGMLTGIRIALALMAIGIGLIHTKDFFAFKRGVSLSIPESAKPGIYARVRRIVTAENLLGAVIGAAVLAVLVNMIELLCTAGLPALYTKILASQELSQWGNYGYLLLYNLAYMFDDMLMVALVVATLKHRKLQEAQGRWLKLVSGMAILILGLVMLVRPQWLGMSP